MLIFRKIRWKNLLSTGNYFTEIELDKTQNTLVIGENGSGKSTLLDALCFVLFGKAFRNINKPNLVNSINGKDCLVEITFEINSKKYKVIRGIKPNLFEIYQDGELLNQEASSRDYQEILETNILKLNYKSFTQIVILGSASFVPFMQLTSADRRSIIEDLLDIQIFSSMNSIVKDKISVNKELTSSKKHEIDLLKQKNDIKKKHIDNIKQNNEQKIKEYETEIQNTICVVENILSNVEILTTESNNLQTEIVDKVGHESKLKKITKLESQIENNLSKIKKDILFFEENDNCPTCKQNIDSEFKSSELNKLNDKSSEYVNALNDIEVKINEQQNIINTITKKQKTINELQVEITKNNILIQEKNKYIDKLNNIIKELKEPKNVGKDEEEEIVKIQNDLNTLNEELKVLMEEKNYLEASSLLLKDSGIKTKIVKQYLPVINKLVNKYLSSLDFFVNFNLDESFKETIKSRHRDEFSYNNFSEGEKQRIDMALMLTWRAVAKIKNSTNTNLLILDEVFDSSLDSNGTEELMKLLHMLENVNLFVISHKGDILMDKFNNVIKFTKEKNFSRKA